MEPSIEQECPQCGGGVLLQETDRSLRCPYCGVNHVIMTEDRFRYVLPPVGENVEHAYVPYLRFKGTVYVCRLDGTEHRIVDITHVGSEVNGLPASLGLRPQALKMRFLDARRNPGVFIRIEKRPADILQRVEQLTDPADAGTPLFHRAYIGDILSVIYMPVFMKGGSLHDGITRKRLGESPPDVSALMAAGSRDVRWAVKILAAICPACGWNLEGERDSVVLTCPNCQTAWEIRGARMILLNVRTVPSTRPRTVYLPFWRIVVSSDGLPMDSFADFMKTTRQPRLPQEDWAQKPLAIWSPAFKIQPKIFLMLSRLVTLSQHLFEGAASFPEGVCHRANLPSSEASQSSKLILAESSVVKKDVVPWLPRIRFRRQKTDLVYLPFDETAHDFVQPDMGVGINRRALSFGRHL